ncbi:MAG: tRNA (guanosine(37)-N1)-methyltransferase TrmD [Bdellovibrionales bacterium]|nr:tRNA (guanosine(37)-N1)-methyltransferase TrmD [Bdellovibrionales bacterium]
MTQGLRRFNVLTIFPEMIRGALQEGLVAQAFAAGKAELHLINPRDFTHDVHRTIDDRPFGGGDGMVMLVEPLQAALQSLGPQRGKTVYLSPQGTPWTDQMARAWSQQTEPVTLVCGRYGGIDQRLIELEVDEEISLGDYVLSGGELGALVVIDSIVRLLPEVLGNAESTEAESFADGLLECPLFSRPREFQGLPVPEVLLSGHHARIEEFRSDVAWVQTALKRPDLLQSQLTAQAQLLKALPRLTRLSPAELRALGLDPWALENLVAKLKAGLLWNRSEVSES